MVSSTMIAAQCKINADPFTQSIVIFFPPVLILLYTSHYSPSVFKGDKEMIPHLTGAVTRP